MFLVFALAGLIALIVGLWIAIRAVQQRQNMPRKGFYAFGGAAIGFLLTAVTAPSEDSQGISECIQASPELVSAILEGAPGATLTDVWVAKSPDRESVYFIAGQFTNAQIFDDQPYGAVWATNDLTLERGLLYSVNAFAIQGSRWGNGPKSDFELSVAEEGARRALICTDEHKS